MSKRVPVHVTYDATKRLCNIASTPRRSVSYIYLVLTDASLHEGGEPVASVLTRFAFSVLRGSVERHIVCRLYNLCRGISRLDQMNLKDDRMLMKKFVQIVEKYPVIYDHTKDGYRSTGLEKAWEEISQIVKDEYNEECTVDELKLKWKGIRSSYNRYKNKLKANKGCQKYYLSDQLYFLDPFLRTKGLLSDKSITDHSHYIDNDLSSESMEEDDFEIKPEVVESTPMEENMVHYVPMDIMKNLIKTDEVKPEKEEKPADDESEDLQFFKCILSDIKGFTSKEKRKFKMGILQLIDDIENERKDT